MKPLLMVPLHLDAFWVETDRFGVEAAADFRTLPYSDGRRDVHFEVAPLADSVLAQPFCDQSFHLAPGIHLHWALPDGLTRAKHRGHGHVFPALPDRWLVVRSRQAEGGGAWQTEKSWVVESDYLWPEGTRADDIRLEGEVYPTINYLLPAGRAGSGQQPWRFLGRTRVLSGPWQESGDGERLPGLTVEGWGELTFAAFYPNCHSVLGLWDRVPGSLAGLRYEVFGWYADPGRGDVVRGLFANLPDDAAGRSAALERELSWQLEAGGEEMPDRLLCHGRWTWRGDGAAPVFDPAGIDVALADTGTEALTACLAARLTAGHDESVQDTEKARIEDQLDALCLADALGPRRLDLAAKLAEARHTRSFAAVPGGTVWTLRQKHPETAGSTLPQESELPPELGHRLHELNQQQMACDRARREIAGRRARIFSHWVKRMSCCYRLDDHRGQLPAIDEVEALIEREIADLAALEAGLAAGLDKAGRLQKQVSDAAPAHDLLPVPAARYWEPNEPVVLVSGPGIEPSDRHGADGLLRCHRLETGEVLTGDPAAVRKRLDEIAAEAPPVGFRIDAARPWHPLILEWEAELEPLAEGSNLPSDSAGYAPDFIRKNYDLGETRCELVRHPGSTVTARASSFSGRSVLSPHARVLLGKRVDEYLAARLAETFQARKTEPPKDLPAWLDAHRDTFLAWLKEPAVSAAYPQGDPIHTVLAACDALAGFAGLSQSLGGFNEALLMHRRGIQLPVADPLGFPEDRRFSEETVRRAVAGQTLAAPQPQLDFHPLRNGEMSLVRLRLVDTFGQVRDLPVDGIVVPQRRVARQVVNGVPRVRPAWTELPARFTQPARVNVRFLAAGSSEEEVNAHPETSPLCGWLVANDLGRRLMVFDASGRALGSLDRRGLWWPPPGGGGPALTHDIQDPALRRMVVFLAAKAKESEGYLDDFLDVLDSALENIDPESSAQHQATALLMHRPMALVRCAVSVELLGPAATHQGWTALRGELQGHAPRTDGFTRVELPIRLGEHTQLGDGVVGYWLEDGDAYAQGGRFFAPQSSFVADANLVIDRDAAGESHDFGQAVDDPPALVSLLVDPRGQIHATSGVLPTKALALPAAHYQKALQAIQVTFLTAPLLIPRGKVEVPLPVEPGWSWSWLAREGAGWTETGTAATVEHQALRRAFADADAVWQRLIDRKWIEPMDDDRARLLPAAADRKASLGEVNGDPAENAWHDRTADVRRVLDAASRILATAQPDARFGLAWEICEGWLRLSPSPGTAGPDSATPTPAQ